MDHPQVWGPWFERNPESWRPWRSFLKVLFALPLTDDDLALYRQCTGRNDPPPGVSSECWLVVGRRGGKSMILALIAVYLAVFRDFKPYLSPGEVASVKILATDRRQSRVIHRYCRALLEQVPTLAAMVTRSDDNVIELNNGIVIEVATASWRGIRGYTIAAALLDEQAFWRTDDAAVSDTEVIAALRPALSTIPNAMLLCASSPYARRGELYNAHRRYFGQDDAPALVWQAATRVMNPSIPQRILDEAYERDPASAAAEYGAEFRSDLSAFLDRQLIESAVDAGVVVRPKQTQHSYTAFADPSGGRGDSFTAAIAHLEDDTVILDALYERRPPFNPTEVVADIAAFLNNYNLSSVTGDKYAAAWVTEAFTKEGISYTYSERDRSSIYLDAVPLFTSGRARLLDHPRLVHQFVSLERRTSSVGKDRIDHGPGGFDDLCNSAAGALVGCSHDPGAIWRALAG